MIGLFMFSFSCNSGKVLLKRDSRWRLVGGGFDDDGGCYYNGSANYLVVSQLFSSAGKVH